VHSAVDSHEVQLPSRHTSPAWQSELWQQLP
jgi:hypothetical protein